MSNDFLSPWFFGGINSYLFPFPGVVTLLGKNYKLCCYLLSSIKFLYYFGCLTDTNGFEPFYIGVSNL